MGYCVLMVRSTFYIAREHLPSALDAIEHLDPREFISHK